MTILWKPSVERQQQSNMTRFIAWLKENKNLIFTSYEILYEWSCNEPALFWKAISDFCNISYQQNAKSIVENQDNIFEAKWFVGARLNFAQNLLRDKDDKLALVSIDELGNRVTYTYAELYKEVAVLAAALKAQGVKAGDRVAAIAPNCVYPIIGMLATTSIGAVWSSCSPDFGEEAIVDRFLQIEPKILIANNAYYFKGKVIDCTSKAQVVAQRIPSVKKLILFSFVHAQKINIKSKKEILWNDLCAPFKAIDQIYFVPIDFSAPVYIMFSSGTTGKPKCIVHSVGGTLIQHLKELVLHTDLKESEHFFFYTTCGWMMWNWLVSGLATGATLVLYDGNPFFPNPDRLMELTENEKISVFGISARYLAALEKSGVPIKEKFSLPALKTILSTGSPLLPESFDYVYREIKNDVCLSSISGGTDIISCFALGNPLFPVYRGELQCRGLGMAVAIFDEHGNAVIDERGELVCTKPFPSMPSGFWNDADRKRYHAAYFERFPGVWAHGDYAELTEHGGLIMFGRSDSVLNPGGVRIGTAEIYAQVEAFSEIEESVAVGQQWDNDERIILFVKLKPGVVWSDDLKKALCDRLRTHESPRHVPAKIIPVPDIPRTISNKISELAVKNVINGVVVKNRGALANPESLVFFEELRAVL